MSAIPPTGAKCPLNPHWHKMLCPEACGHKMLILGQAGTISCGQLAARAPYLVGWLPEASSAALYLVSAAIVAPYLVFEARRQSWLRNNISRPVNVITFHSLQVFLWSQFASL